MYNTVYICIDTYDILGHPGTVRGIPGHTSLMREGLGCADGLHKYHVWIFQSQKYEHLTDQDTSLIRTPH